MGMKKKFFIETYGCEMNKSDTIDISLSLQESGYEPTRSEREADVVILNTCAVRENAEERILGRLGYYRSLLKTNMRHNPGSRGTSSPRILTPRNTPPLIVLAGCMAQERGEEIARLFPEVGVVTGTYHLLEIPKYVERFEKERAHQIALDRSSYHFSPYRGQRAETFRAWVTIMKGCSNFCSYCIVPYVRGPEVSKRSVDVIQEVEELAAKGVVEITLLGQNVNAYGRDNGDLSFIDLLERIHSIQGIRWIRFLTSHPKDFNEEIIKRISLLPKVCRHIHLPLQSGSDRILRLMNRKYTIGYYRSVLEAIGRHLPSASITSDLIVGFPTECDEDFLSTLDAARTFRFDDAFTYRYSERPFTKAANLREKVPEEVVRQRLEELIACQRSLSVEKNNAEIGTTQVLLVERESKKNPQELLCKTETGKMVVAKTDARPGDFIEAEISGISGSTLRGTELRNIGNN